MAASVGVRVYTIGVGRGRDLDAGHARGRRARDRRTRVPRPQPRRARGHLPRHRSRWSPSSASPRRAVRYAKCRPGPWRRRWRCRWPGPRARGAPARWRRERRRRGRVRGAALPASRLAAGRRGRRAAGAVVVASRRSRSGLRLAFGGGPGAPSLRARRRGRPERGGPAAPVLRCSRAGRSPAWCCPDRCSNAVGSRCTTPRGTEIVLLDLSVSMRASRPVVRTGSRAPATRWTSCWSARRASRSVSSPSPRRPTPSPRRPTTWPRCARSCRRWCRRSCRCRAAVRTGRSGWAPSCWSGAARAAAAASGHLLLVTDADPDEAAFAAARDARARSATRCPCWASAPADGVPLRDARRGAS